jgi:hypothetical protein
MRCYAPSGDVYGFIDALDVAGGAEILVRGHGAGEGPTRVAREPLDGESLPVIAEFPSIEALLNAGWRID